MNWIDLTILGIITLSTFVGFWRGFPKEIIALLCWIIACIIALKFSSPLSGLLGNALTSVPTRYLLAFAFLVIVTLVVSFLLRMTFSNFVEGSGELTQLDRFLGLLFGGARGSFIVAILVYISQATTYPTTLDWQQSQLIPHFEKTSALFMSFMPAAPDFLSSKERLRQRTFESEQHLAKQED